MCLEIKGVDMTAQRQQKNNKMCLAIEKMKEEGRREEREKLAKALEEEREKSLKALDEERKNGICNLIATCRDFGESLEKVCQRLMRSYHLTHSEATAYLKEYYV